MSSLFRNAGRIAPVRTVLCGFLSVSLAMTMSGPVLSAPVIDYADGTVITSTVVVSTDTTQLQALSGVTATQSGDITDDGNSRPIEKIGAGTLILSGSNDYGGSTVISEGTLVLDVGTASVATSDYFINSGATLSLSAFDDFDVNSLNNGTSGGGTVDVGFASTLYIGHSGLTTNSTFSGEITGSGELVMENAASLTLDGMVNHQLSYVTLCNCTTGSLTLSAGSFTVDGETNVFSGTLTVNNGAIWNTGDLYVAGGAFEASGTGTQVNVDFFTGIGDPFASPSSLRILAGATMQSLDGMGVDGDILGNAATVTVSGSGSSLTVEGSELEIGDFADGIVTVAEGGVINAYDGIYIGADGILNIGDGGLAGSVSSVTNYFTNDGQIIADVTDIASLTDVIDGSGSITKRGTGTLILDAANSFTGSVTLEGGTLVLTNANSAGADFSGLITTTGASTIRYENLIDVFTPIMLNTNNTELQANGIALQSGTISETGGSRGLTISGAGTVVLSSIANTFSGDVTINSGATLGINFDENLGLTGNTLQFNGGTLLFWSPVVDISLSRTIRIDGGAIFDTSVWGSTIAHSIGPGIVPGADTLTKTGDGSLILTGTNTYAGVTTVTMGDLYLGNGGTTGSISGDLVVDGPDATVNFYRSDDVTYAGAIRGSGNLIKVGSNMLALTGDNSGFTGELIVGGGTLLAASADNIGGTNSLLTIQNATLLFGADFDLHSGQSVLARNATIDTNGNNAAITQGLTGSGRSGGIALTKTGAGRLSLNGTSTYINATVVDGGTLAVNGSIAASSSVTVNSGATLGGTGTVSTTTVASGGALAPGNSIGTLTVNGDLTLDSGSTFGVEVDNSGADKVIVTGTTSIAGDLIVNFATGQTYTATQYTILASTGALSGNFATFNTLGIPVGYLATVSYNANNAFVNLSYLPVIWANAPVSTDWNNGANWLNGLVPPSTEVAQFGATSGQTITVSQATSAGSLNFTSTAPTYAINITGNSSTAASLTLTGGIVDDGSFAPNITASGVSSTRTGTLAFTGTGNAADANLVAGSFGTISFAGMTNAGAASRLTANSGGTVNFAGTTGAANDNKVSAGSIAGAGSFILGSNTLTVGALNSNTEVSGVISGTGGLTKVGTGTLTLSGVNTYNGATLLNAGTLVVNGSIADSALTINGGMLKGTGTLGSVAVGSGTTLAPGNSIGTLNVASISFASGSNYEVETDATGAADRINATGAATLNNATVQVLAAAGIYAPVTTYRIISAGSVAGTFGAVTSNIAALTPTLIYSGTAVDLQLMRNDLAFGTAFGTTPNQLAAGGAVSAAGVGSSLYQKVAIASTSASAGAAALDALSGEFHASLLTGLLNNGTQARAAMLGDMRGNVAGGISIWARVNGNWSNTKSDRNADALRGDSADVVFGADTMLVDNVRAGIEAGFENATLRAPNRGSSARLNSGHFGGYLSTNVDAATLRGGMIYGWGTAKTIRAVVFTGVSDTNLSSQASDTLQVFGEASYRLDADGILVAPFAGVSWIQANAAAFSETGGTSALSGNAVTPNQTFLSLGADFAMPIAQANGASLLPSLRLAWEHGFANGTMPRRMTVISTGQSFTVLGTPLTQDRFLVDAKLALTLTEGFNLSVGYRGAFSQSANDNGVNGALAWKF